MTEHVEFLTVFYKYIDGPDDGKVVKLGYYL
jgi:hypothetical protein